MRIFLDTDAVRKRELQRHLTALLPEWFGVAEANAAYARMAESLDGFVAQVDGHGCGLLLTEKHGARSVEIAWMGVEPMRHRTGIGRALLDAALEHARKAGTKFAFVATLHPDDPYEPYARTRRFYESMGFEYVLKEQFPADPANPLAYYLKIL
jgi:GNAT superfamily N-acetyltransferase